MEIKDAIKLLADFFQQTTAFIQQNFETYLVKFAWYRYFDSLQSALVGLGLITLLCLAGAGLMECEVCDTSEEHTNFRKTRNKILLIAWGAIFLIAIVEAVKCFCFTDLYGINAIMNMLK